ncbi:MAG: hypothetical protein ACQEVA_23040 [Myxococcota bacterium]
MTWFKAESSPSLRAVLYAIACVPLALSLSCGPNTDDGGGSPSFDDMELGEIAPADESSFDVDWSADTVVADEATVLADLEDLQPWDDVYRVPAESELLDGIEQGSIVVWPQVGIFEIVEVRDDGDMVEIETKWARFSDAVDRADIQFTHALEAGQPGRAVGMRPAPTQSNQLSSRATQSLEGEAGPFDYSEDGVTYNSGSLSTTLGVQGDTINVDFSTNTSAIKGDVSGSVSGLTAEGLIFLDPEAEDPDPSVLIDFQNVRANVTAKLSVEGAGGSDEIVTPAVVTFPFMVGPIPAYIAVGLRFQVRSSISSPETLVSVESGFSINGSVTLGRNDDGSFGAEGSIGNFQASSPRVEFETQSTAGIGLDVDTPRISFGMGRPKLASASVFGTHSYEIVGNVRIDPVEKDYCAEVGTGSAILVGGEIGAFGWSASQEYQVANQSGESSMGGPACD